MTRLLLVEDEAPIRAGLVELFRSQGFVVDDVDCGLKALEKLAGPRYDAVLLDVMIPGIDGLKVLAHVRERGDRTPVLLLTAKSAEEDVVRGLEQGADDYVTKPFGIHELVARVKGLLRRAAAADDGAPRKLSIGGAVLDLDNLRVSVDAAAVGVTAREAMLLEFLYANRQRAVGRDELLVHVWGYQDGTIQTRTVDVHVQQLRAKLKAIPGGEKWIGTVRGKGYRLEAA